MKKLIYLSLCGLLAGTQVASAQVSCNAQYSASAAPTGSMPLRTNFNNTSTVGNPNPANTFTSQTLYFGDGSSFYAYFGSNNYHNYAAPGTYNTMLVLRNYDSLTNTTLCSDTAYQTISVNYAPCFTSITSVDNGSGSFTFTASNPAGTPGQTYSWFFGDGATGTGSPVTHTYAVSGNFQVTLSGTGSGCTGGDTIVVHNNDTIIDCSLLDADFYSYVNNQTGTAYFTNTSSYAGLSIYNVANWHFGDGSSQMGSNPAHTYSASGTYNVVLYNQWVDSLTNQVVCSDSISKPVAVSVTSPANYIQGVIYWDSLAPMPPASDTFKVWLIQHDTTANTLTAVDSQYVTAFMQQYQFNNKPAGDYLTKAALLGQATGTTGYVPTYHLNSIYWSGATNIHHTGGASYAKHIIMQTGTVTSGPGFVGGNISLGGNKGTGAGIANMIVYLRNAEQKLIASTYTDEDGDYTFSNIPVGTYNVYPEAMNYATTPYNAIEVTAAQTHVTAIDFVQKNDLIYPKSSTTGIAGVTKEDGLSIYPNPTKDYVMIESKGNRFDKVQIVNTLGQAVRTVKLQAGINKIELSGLNAGVYYILVSGRQDARSMKLIKQ